MMSIDEIRGNVLDLKRRGVKMTGHRAMLVQLLGEIDALTSALRGRWHNDLDADRNAYKKLYSENPRP